MKMTRVVAWALLLAAPLAAAPDIEFTGVLVLPKVTKFTLTDKTAGVSQWLTIGDSFTGYTVSAYDAKEESIVLTKDGQQTRLRLVSAKTTEAAPSPQNTEHIVKAGETLALIARQNGITVQRLVELNPGIVPTNIKVGQKLKLK